MVHFPFFLMSDNIVNDTEWYAFYKEFLAPFQACDADKNWVLSVAELKTCFESDEKYFQSIAHHFKTDDDIELLLHHMDCNDANLHGYIFLRRLNHAWNVCAVEEI